MLSTGLARGVTSKGVFFPVKLDCVWNVGEQHEQRVGQVQSAASLLVRATDKSVACAAIDRGRRRGVGGVAQSPLPAALEQQTYAWQLISLVQLIMCQRHFVNQPQQRHSTLYTLHSSTLFSSSPSRSAHSFCRAVPQKTLSFRLAR